MINIALLQFSPVWENAKANIKYVANILAQNTNKTDIVFLPEMFSTGFTMKPELVAEPMDGYTVNSLKELSITHKTVICGTIPIIENNKFFNRLIWIQPDGLVFHYDKRHLFHYSNEDKHYSSGNKKLTIQYKGWKIRLLICYDLRFPVWAKNNYINQEYEYDMLVYLANWPSSRSHIWKSLLIARAIENQCYVVGVNCTGIDGNGFTYQGESVVIDAKGMFIEDYNIEKETIIHTAIYKKPLDDFRNKFTVAKDWDKFIISDI